MELRLVRVRKTTEEKALLLEGGLPEPWMGTRYQPGSGAGESVAEVVEIFYRGRSAQIAEELESLGRWLAEDEIKRGVYLQLTPAGGSSGQAWRSRLLSAWLELQPPGPAPRATGGQGLRIHLARHNYWEGPATSLPLSNANGRLLSQGIKIWNHWDGHAGHENFAEVQGEALSGTLPAPLRLKLANSYQEPVQVGRLYVGLDAHTENAPAGAWLVLEGEAASAPLGAAVADEMCSGGAARRGPVKDWGLLMAWELDSECLAGAGARRFWPLLRLAQPTPADLWLGWELTFADPGPLCALQESERKRAAQGERLIELPPLELPPVDLGDPHRPLQLKLMAANPAGEGVDLEVDYLFLLPLDAWRVFWPWTLLPFGWTLADDARQGWCASSDWEGRQLRTHSTLGPGIWVTPGQNQRLYFLHAWAANCAPEAALSLSVEYCPRRRVV